MSSRLLLAFTATLALALVGCENDSSSTRISFTVGDDLQVGGIGEGRVFGQRYEIYVPSGYRITEPTPLLVAVHGTGGDPGQMISLFRTLADSENFIVLAPSYFFNDELFPFPYGSDTIGLVEAMIAEVRSVFNVDGDRLYLTGFSTGGTWAYIYGLEFSTEFAASSAFAAGYTGTNPIDAQNIVSVATRPIPFYLVHGVNDLVFDIENARVAEDALDAAGHPVFLDEHGLGHGIPVGSEVDVWGFLEGFSL